MNAGVVDLTKSYSENGYAILKEAFSEKALAAVGQALLCTLAQGDGGLAPRDGGEPPLNETILATDARNHGSVYAAAQSVGTSAAAYQLVGKPEFLDLLLAITGAKLAELHLMPMYLIIQMPSD